MDAQAGLLANFLQPYGGPRPINTLSRGVPTSTQTVSHRLNAPRQTGQQLETGTIVGDNVKYSTLGYNLDPFHLAEPSPKRRKLEQQRNSQNSPQVVDGSDDAEQILIDDDVVHVKHINNVSEDGVPGNNKPIVNWGNSKPTQPHADGRLHGREYHAVEDLMNSSVPSSKKHKNRHTNGTHNTLVAEGSSFASSNSESVELLDAELNVDPSAKGQYRGTANPQQPRRSRMASKADTRRRTSDRSPYFPALTPHMVFSKPDNRSKNVKRSSPPTEMRLRDQYRDSDGKQRGGAESADELDVAEPNSRALSPVKPARNQSPTKKTQSEATRRYSIDDELNDPHTARSDIKPSTFTGVPSNGSYHKVSRSKYPDEMPAPWSMPLRAYNFRGQTHEDDATALVFNNAEKSYDVKSSGENLANRHPDLRIRPEKLQRIWWALDGTKMRFQSSKTIDVDNILDIEVRGEKDVQKLNALMQERGGSMQVKGEPRSVLPYKVQRGQSAHNPLRKRMDHMFDHKIQEYHKNNAILRNINRRQPDDVHLADQRIHRADQKRAIEEQHRAVLKRPRLVDQLSNGRPQDKQWIQDDKFSDKTATEDNYGTMTERKSSTAFDLGKLDLLESSLKHDLRSRHATRGSSKPLRETSRFPFNQEVQNEEVQKYSETHGLGKPWPKPLVYPKEGKKRTTVCFDDLKRLDEGEFLNDSLIAFYLRYLEHQAEQRDHTMARRVYMFNTFFYASLTSSKPGQRGISYEAVQKWTRGIDLFTYDFVVVPVNESAHWYIAIICNLPALNRRLGGFDDESAPDVGSPKGTEFDQAPKDKLLLSSSPRTAAGSGDCPHVSRRTDDPAEDPKEHETTASFAEMSLETPNTSIDTGDFNSDIPTAFRTNYAEQELLDGQLQQVTANGQDGGDPDARGLQSADRKVEEVVETDKPTSPRLRSGKRKSLASTRVFDPYKPTILTFDSFGTAHAQTVRVLKQYLREEASDKRGQMEFDEKELQGVTAKQIPQQDNFCDCGLYLLGYMEKFFENPREFIDKIMRRQWDVEKDWPNLGPSIMRTNLRNLLLGLGKSHLEELESARNARRANATSKASKGTTPSSKAQISRSEPSNVDGANSAGTTPTKCKFAEAQNRLSEDPAIESAENIKRPIQRASLPPDEAPLESPRLNNEAAVRQSHLPKEAASKLVDHVDGSNQLLPQEAPSTRQAALLSALPIDEDVQQQQPASEGGLHSSRIAIPVSNSAAETQPPPGIAVEESPPDSFIVPDSQPQSSKGPQSDVQDKESESHAISPDSPELPSTIQDSQPGPPELAVQDVRKEATTPRPTRSKRHMTSFSSPLPAPRSTTNPDEEHKSPKSPKSTKSFPPSTHSEQQKSSPATRSSKQRPLLGSKPAVTGTNPKVVIQID
ncbi:MAG: hypothetical protein LQ337_000454 [Flavoplaca oasis]|nr:MAG: hypothetical protein LQ337_000454 [Flavoplaca oasis]